MKIRRNNICYIICIYITCFTCNITALVAQEQHYYLEIRKIEHNKESNTIDLYIIAQKDLQPYFTFSTQDLKVWESMGADTSWRELSWPVLDILRKQEFFGSDEGIRIPTQSTYGLHTSPRLYKVEWWDKGSIQKTDIRRKKWSNTNSAELKSRFSIFDILVLGMLLVSIILLVLSEFIPAIRLALFNKKFVKPYYQVKSVLVERQDKNRRRMDDPILVTDERRVNSITGRDLKDDKKVVMFCSREQCGVELSRWEKRQYQCPNYPNSCDGVYNIGFQRFFQQSGIYRPLNWLWFGTLGGLVAWILNAVFAEMVGYNEIFRGLIYGISLGFGLSSMLSFVEEKGLPGDFAWERILIRVLLGTLVSGLIFLLGELLVPITGDLSWLMHSVVWIIFSLALGAVLSYKSSIELKRGLLSGLIAGLISSIVYVLSKELFLELKLSQIISFIFMGGIMGLGIIQVVKQLQVIELQVLNPPERSGLIFSLDKILNSGKKIVIGKQMKVCDVRIKWKDDFAIHQHAEMVLRNKKVSIYPLEEGEILINGIMVQKNNVHQLQGGDIIQLGRQSRTKFKYLQKT